MFMNTNLTANETPAQLTSNRLIYIGDLVSYRRRAYKVATVWGAAMPGYISINVTLARRSVLERVNEHNRMRTTVA